jgi:hypothetical protein
VAARGACAAASDAIEYLRNHSSLTCEDFCGVEIVLDNEQFQPA